MTDSPFDRFTRLLAGSRSRRQALAALGALAAARLQPAHAAQLELAACGEAGAVCTQLLGCCSGLVCATSTVNPAYGVCITGEGEMLPVTDGLVVPGSEGITEELAGQSSDAAADASSAESILAAQEAEIQSRRTARNTRQAAQQTRLQSNRTAQQTRKALNRTERRDRKDLNRLNQEPKLELTLKDNADGTKPEILRVRNNENASVVISRVESIDQLDVFASPTITSLEDGTFFLLSGPEAEDAAAKMADASDWTSEDVCLAGKGVRLKVAQFGATKSHWVEVPCGQTVSTGNGSAPDSESGKKTRKTGQGQKKAKRGKQT